ncbi:MAG: hypothetical protein QM811_10955 [Pirellulales bacterium]
MLPLIPPPSERLPNVPLLVRPPALLLLLLVEPKPPAPLDENPLIPLMPPPDMPPIELNPDEPLMPPPLVPPRCCATTSHEPAARPRNAKIVRVAIRRITVTWGMSPNIV